jgi:hypothetical protein
VRSGQLNMGVRNPETSTSLGLLTLLMGSVLFAVAHTQAPLYYSNQNQYCLHGLAAAGLGYLDRDWLANTVDPTPVFSALVEFTQRHLDPVILQVDLFILAMIYFATLMAIGGLVIPAGPSRRFSLVALGVALTLIHAGIGRWASVRLFGYDYTWNLQCGVANQYILGPDLQPSAFGVLLASSMAAFAYGRPIVAVVCACVACCFHATYLLPSAMLTFTYMLLLWRDGRSRAALFLGAGSLLAVLPVVVHAWLSFAPTSTEIFQESQRILAEVRIPHHAQIDRWFDRIAAVQIAWVVLGIILLRKSKLAILLGIPSLCGLVLSLIQWKTGSDALALLFPWRISAVLAPIATAIVFARLICCVPDSRRIRIVLGGAAAIAIIGGVVIDVEGWGYRHDDRELAALDYVRTHKQPGDVYLLPVHIPNNSAGKPGSASTSFTAPPGINDKNLIAADLQRFRLFTGAPIYIDFKSVPYKDAEVLEWYRRVLKAHDWYARNDWNIREVRDELRKEGIKHIVLTADRSIDGDGYEQVYADSVYRIYRLAPE